MPFIKPEDVGYFSALLSEVDEEQLSNEEQRDRRIMMLLLKVKNGTPPMRKSALKTLTEKAREFGAGPLFN
jgi:splicing factor 3B subunit 1